MGAFIVKQPNGLLCRFSTVVDTVTHYNMTEEEYIELCAERARDEARWVLENKLRPYEWVKSHFIPGNMTQKEFDAICQEMERTDHKEIKEEIKEADMKTIDEKELDKLANECYYEMSDVADVNCADVKEAYKRGYRQAMEDKI